MIKAKVRNDKKKTKDESTKTEPSFKLSENSDCQVTNLDESLESLNMNVNIWVDSVLENNYLNQEELHVDESSNVNDHMPDVQCDDNDLSVEPSAPIMLEDISSDLDLSECIQNDRNYYMQVDEEITMLCRNIEFIENTSEIKPYTENQLLTLYNNCFLNDKERIVSDFLDREKNILKCEFYDIMQTFLDARLSLNRIEEELLSCSETLIKLHKCAWAFEEVTKCEDDVCSDNVLLKGHFKHETAHFQANVAKKLVKYSKKIRTIISESHTLYIYQAEMQKVRVQNFLQNVISQCSMSDDLPRYSPVTCFPNENHLASDHIKALKECISVLFSFCRRGIDDDKFDRELKSMLCDAVAMLLRYASYDDNFFVLNHLLRCPAGVGDWGAHFIQVPSPSNISDPVTFGCPELDYALTILSIMLSPIKQRDSFLACYKGDRSKFDTAECEWVVIEGKCERENNGKLLTENDVIQFLNQIPFEGIFKHILSLEDYVISANNSNNASPHSIMKLLAFSTCLFKIFESGLLNYCQSEYHGVTKRICRLIGHTILYVTQHRKQYQSCHLSLQDNDDVEGEAMVQRLQIEYDEFMERIIGTIFNLRHISGVWESLCAMPYNNISTYKLCKLLCHLFTGYTESFSLDTDYRQLISNNDVSERFFDFVLQMDDNAVIFFLTALSNMAVMRQSIEEDIIEIITINIFKVSFIKNDGKECTNRVGREVLAAITNAHPNVISTLIATVQDNLPDIGCPTLYFFKHLNLKHWILTKEDIDSISNWTLCPPNSLQNQMARTILGKLNWGFASNGELLLSRKTQMMVMLSLVEAYIKVYSSQHIGSNLISSSVKQVTSVVYSSSQEQVFLKWCWLMAGNFHLHNMDQSQSVMKSLIVNPFNFLRSIPDPQSSPELSLIKIGLRSNDPFCIFVAHLMSTWGHSIPEFCINGPKSLEILVAAGHYEAALTIVFLITPLFFQQHEDITTNVGFIKAIHSILNVDNKYSNIAIRLVSSGAPEETWKLFSSLIVVQINEYKKYNLNSPRTIVSFWFNILLSLPNWANETPTVNVLNVICQHSVNDHQCWLRLKDDFVEELKLKMRQQNTTSTLTSIYNWVTITSESSNLLTKYSNVHQPWFALLALQCEAKIQNSLWKQLLKLLHTSSQLSITAAIQDVCSELDLQPINPNLLSVYRFGQQVLDLPVDDAAFSVTLQGFLTLHLARVLPESHDGDHISVIHKFYEGYINFKFLKKIQQKVKNFVTFCINKRVENEQNISSQCVDLLQAMGNWLNDPKYCDAGFYIPSLSPKDKPKELSLLLDGEWKIWQELVNSDQLQECKDMYIKMWESHRLLKECSSPIGSPSMGLIQRKMIIDLSDTFKRLREYDPPRDPPPIYMSTAGLQLNISLHPEDLLFDIDRVVDIFVERSNSVMLTSRELCALDCVFLELMPTLWSNKTKKTVVNVECTPSRMSKIKKCTGAANIIIEYSGKHLNEEIRGRLAFNRQKRKCFVKMSTQAPTLAMSQAALKLEKIIQKIIIWSRFDGGEGVQKSENLIKTGRRLFYHLLGKISDETNFYPPAKQLLLDSINSLGQEFISGHSDCQKELIGSILKSEHVCNSLMSSHFTPMASEYGSFLELYEMASSYASSQPDVTFMLLSKFELEAVLRQESISVEGRRKLIEIITNILISLLVSDDGSTQICSELYRVHLNMILSYNFFDHFNQLLITLLDMTFLIPKDTGKIVSNLLLDYINTLTRRVVVINTDMDMSDLFSAIKEFVNGQRLLNEIMVENIIQCLTGHFGVRRVQFGLHGLYPKYKGYVKPIAIILGMISCLSAHVSTNNGNDLSHVWNCIESLFSPWLCPMGRDMKESCPKWVQEFSHDQQLLLPWSSNCLEEPAYMSAIFAGVAQLMYESSNENIVLSKLLDFYCRTFANQDIKDHVITVVNSSFSHVYWHHLSPSINDLESINRIMNDYLPECHSFLGNIFVQINWVKVEERFRQHDEGKLARFNVLFLNILIRVAMEQSIRQKSNNLREIIITAERFHWELLDLASFENVINWVVISCDPRIVLNSETRNPIDIAVINILYIAAGFTHNHHIEHPECHLKRCLLVRAFARLLVTCSKKHNILMVSRMAIFEQTYAILFNHIENTIIEAIPKTRQFNEAIDLAGEALKVIEGMASSSSLQEVCRNSLINWLKGQHTSDIFLFPLLVTISRNILQMQHRCALLEESIRTVFIYQEGKDTEDRLSWPDITGRMSFPVSNPIAMFNYAAQENYLLVIYTYCRWKLTVKGDADDCQLLSNLNEIFPKLKPNESSETGFILIISLIVYLLASQIEITGSQKLLLWRCAESFSTQLDIFGVDSSSAGLLQVFGFWTESCLPVRARLVCRSLSAFLTCQLVQPGFFRSLNERTLDDDETPLDDSTAKALTYLKAVKKNSLYSEYISSIDWVISFIKNYCHTILDGSLLLAGLIKLMYYNNAALKHLTFKVISTRNDPVIEQLFQVTPGGK